MKNIVIDYLKKVTSLPKEEIEKIIETPPSSNLGDYAFPCFVLAKTFKESPAFIASKLVKEIKSDYFEKVEARGPYVNFFINRKKLAKEILFSILKEKDKYGSQKDKKTIMVEFSQANTHKAFHVGHIRATSIGESISRILEFHGNKAIRANYQGDTGMHVAKWIWCYKRYHSKEELKKDESWISSIYVEAVRKLSENETLQEEVDEINRKLEERKDKELMKLWKTSRDYSLEAFEKIYSELNTKFDKYYFEREVEERAKEISKELVKKRIAKIDGGATIIDFGDSLGIWVLLRKDGTVLYSAKDLALAEKKFKDYKLDKAIATIGAAQFLHTSQITKALELMKFLHVKNYEFIHFSEVRLPSGKMSSRTGENILYSDFMKEVKEYAISAIMKRHEKINEKEIQNRALKISVASIKYALLKQDSNKVIVFNKEEALNFEGNTGPYLLYSYARAKSILRKAKYNQNKEKNLEITNISDKERILINRLAAFPDITNQSYLNLSPNTIANYTYQLAQEFNEFYHSSKVIGSDEESFRLSLVDAFSQVLKNSINLLGIEVIEKM